MNATRRPHTLARLAARCRTWLHCRLERRRSLRRARQRAEHEARIMIAAGALSLPRKR